MPKFSSIRLHISFSIVVFILLQLSAYADSLWVKRAAVNTNLFADNRARSVGDIITVIIEETTAIEGLEDSELDSSSKFSNNVDASNFVVGKDGVSQVNRFMPNISGEHNTSFDGEGEYESSRDIRFRLTAMVTEVLGNGNLLIEGKRGVSINKERYTLRVSGIVRPIDIEENNVVFSEKIANANIFLEGKGFLTRAAKRGWGHRLFEVLWPF